MPIEFVCFDYKIKLDFYFLSLVAFMMVTDDSFTIVYGLIFAFMHELGHILSMKILGYKIENINFGVLNIDIINEKRKFSENKFKEFLILFSGCAINFLFAGLFEFLYVCSKISIFNVMFIQNISIGIFNLLPINSLDGAKILEIFIKDKLSYSVSVKIFDLISMLFLIPVIFLGVFVIIKSQHNFSLFIVGVYLLSLFLKKDYCRI